MKRLFKKINNLNNNIAIKTMAVVATMGCTYTFLLWSLLPLALPATQNMVFYVSGGILQLVLLPLIMVGQKLTAAAADNNHAEASNHRDELKGMIESLEDMVSDNETELELLSTIVHSLQVIMANQQAVMSKLMIDSNANDKNR